MPIAIGCDHRGVKTKQLVIKLIAEAKNNYQDFGTDTTSPVDYPNIAKRVAEAVVKGDFERGILICDTGIGMSIAANKIKGIRAALCYNNFTAKRARQHNNANVLCLGIRHKDSTIRVIIEAFLKTEFEGGRHIERLNEIKAMECLDKLTQIDNK